MSTCKKGIVQRQRHVPQRTCIGCREVRPKRDMVRIVCNADGRAAVDPTGKMPGRGCYLCQSAECWDTLLKKDRLERALRIRVSEEDRGKLSRYADIFRQSGDRDA